ncbi:hypothetical protein GRJ2_001991200 [Grus japonensis]|uniref:Uncharacterized protein n=1 Tax=Grus japonensis TaxID=30415 RepID=A0ABC9XCI7_GRUJA
MTSVLTHPTCPDRVPVTCQIKMPEQPIHSKPDKHSRSMLHHERLVADVHSDVFSHAENTTQPLDKSVTAAYCISQVVIYSVGT